MQKHTHPETDGWKDKMEVMIFIIFNLSAVKQAKRADGVETAAQRMRMALFGKESLLLRYLLY